MKTSGVEFYAVQRSVRIQQLSLSRGNHGDISNGACVMEAASYLSGGQWSAHSYSISRIIGTFLRSWNDGLSNTDRNRLLKPLISSIIGTGTNSLSIENKRVELVSNWYTKKYMSYWLEEDLKFHGRYLHNTLGVLNETAGTAARNVLTYHGPETMYWPISVYDKIEQLNEFQLEIAIQHLQNSALDLVQRMIAIK